MKRSLPKGRTGQLLALGLTLLAFALLWLGIVMPLIDWHTERAAALAHQEMLTQRMDALAAALPSLQEQAKAEAAGGAGEAALLDGDNDSMASASLQERLQAMFMQAGVQLNSVETLPGDDAGAYRRIGLRISFNASWPVLMTLLKEMHVATPSLLVDELQVTPALHRISTAPGSFDVACAIFAFRSASAAKVAAR
jgi:general secretion pathway protein M